MHVAPGESQEISIRIPLERLAYCHRDGRRRVDGGRYDFFIGQDASDGTAHSVEVSA